MNRKARMLSASGPSLSDENKFFLEAVQSRMSNSLVPFYVGVRCTSTQCAKNQFENIGISDCLLRINSIISKKHSRAGRKIFRFIYCVGELFPGKKIKISLRLVHEEEKKEDESSTICP